MPFWLFGTGCGNISVSAIPTVIDLYSLLNIMSYGALPLDKIHIDGIPSDTLRKSQKTPVSVEIYNLAVAEHCRTRRSKPDRMEGSPTNEDIVNSAKSEQRHAMSRFDGARRNAEAF